MASKERIQLLICQLCVAAPFKLAFERRIFDFGFQLTRTITSVRFLFFCSGPLSAEWRVLASAFNQSCIVAWGRPLTTQGSNSAQHSSSTPPPIHQEQLPPTCPLLLLRKQSVAKNKYRNWQTSVKFCSSALFSSLTLIWLINYELGEP